MTVPADHDHDPDDDRRVEATGRRLTAAGCVAAEAEAVELVSMAPDEPTLEQWIGRREQGEPLAWIVGRTRFGGAVIGVDPGVYVPRPQTEALARRAVDRLQAVEPDGGSLLDLCTGAGAIAAQVRRRSPDAWVVGVDLDVGAARCAHRNGVPAFVGDLAEAIGGAGRFDVITAVPPYVPTGDLRLLPVDVQRYESLVALDGGPDGLALARRIVQVASRLLRTGGSLLIELGGAQDQLLGPDLANAGFEQVEWWRDDEGDLRGVEARLSVADRQGEGPARG